MVQRERKCEQKHIVCKYNVEQDLCDIYNFVSAYLSLLCKLHSFILCQSPWVNLEPYISSECFLLFISQVLNRHWEAATLEWPWLLFHWNVNGIHLFLVHCWCCLSLLFFCCFVILRLCWTSALRHWEECRGVRVIRHTIHIIHRYHNNEPTIQIPAINKLYCNPINQVWTHIRTYYWLSKTALLYLHT